MHAEQIVRRFVSSVPGIHKSRIRSYSDLVSAVIHGGRLTLTQLGRRLSGPNCKANLKRVERLIGSPRVGDEMVAFAARTLEVCEPQAGALVIGVDWSPAKAGGAFMELRASLLNAGMGRGVTIYQEVHPQEQYASPSVEARFLRRLKRILPAGCQVILVTDAGFRRHWFIAAERYGYSWIGRIRQGQMLGEKGNFQPVTHWFGRASPIPRKVADIKLTKQHQKLCDLVLWRKPKRERKHYRRPGHGPTTKAAKEAKASAREPWLLGCSTDLRYLSADRIADYYALRMQIEENFRDHKSTEFGFGQETSQSRSLSRIQALLLLGTIAAFVMWHIGQLAETEGLHRRFRVTTRKSRELSLISLARALCEHPRWLLSHLATRSLAARMERLMP